MRTFPHPGRNRFLLFDPIKAEYLSSEGGNPKDPFDANFYSLSEAEAKVNKVGVGKYQIRTWLLAMEVGYAELRDKLILMKKSTKK